MFLIGCDSTKQHENYKLNTEADLILTHQNHPHGFQNYQCFLCHHPDNIHKENRLNLSAFDYAQILVEQSGLQSCQGCHGKNGAQ